MKVLNLIEKLKEYPPDTQVMIFDHQDNEYFEPGFEKVDVIRVTDCGSEKVVDIARKSHYGEGLEFKILALK